MSNVSNNSTTNPPNSNLQSVDNNGVTPDAFKQAFSTLTRLAHSLFGQQQWFSSAQGTNTPHQFTPNQCANPQQLMQHICAQFCTPHAPQLFHQPDFMQSMWNALQGFNTQQNPGYQTMGFHQNFGADPIMMMMPNAQFFAPFFAQVPPHMMTSWGMAQSQNSNIYSSQVTTSTGYNAYGARPNQASNINMLSNLNQNFSTLSGALTGDSYSQWLSAPNQYPTNPEVADYLNKLFGYSPTTLGTPQSTKVTNEDGSVTTVFTHDASNGGYYNRTSTESYGQKDNGIHTYSGSTQTSYDTGWNTGFSNGTWGGGRSIGSSSVKSRGYSNRSAEDAADAAAAAFSGPIGYIDQSYHQYYAEAAAALEASGQVGSIDGGHASYYAGVYAKAGAGASFGPDGLNASFSAAVGAEVRAHAGFGAPGETAVYGIVEAKAFAGASANGNLTIGKDGVSANVNAYAGAYAEVCGEVGCDYGSIGGGVKAWAGVGVSAGADIKMKDGKLDVAVNLGAALGVGLEFDINFSINFKAIGHEVSSWFTKKGKVNKWSGKVESAQNKIARAKGDIQSLESQLASAKGKKKKKLKRKLKKAKKRLAKAEKKLRKAEKKLKKAYKKYAKKASKNIKKGKKLDAMQLAALQSQGKLEGAVTDAVRSAVEKAKAGGERLSSWEKQALEMANINPAQLGY